MDITRADLETRWTVATIALLERTSEVDGATVSNVDRVIESRQNTVTVGLLDTFTQVELDAERSADSAIWKAIKTATIGLIYYDLWADKSSPKDPPAGAVTERNDAIETLAQVRATKRAQIERDESTPETRSHYVKPLDPRAITLDRIRAWKSYR